MVHLTVCSYHATYRFQSESTLYSYLNVKKLLAQNRHKIESLSDCNWTWTYNHLVHKWILNHEAKLAKWLSCVKCTIQISTHKQLNHLASLAKWLSVHLWTKWLWVRVQLQSLKLQISRLFQARSSLTFRQL